VTTPAALVARQQRTREIGVRLSIGARRKDVVRQFPTESVLNSTGGGVPGFGLFLSCRSPPPPNGAPSSRPPRY
jgi:hypothetical protein